MQKTPMRPATGSPPSALTALSSKTEDDFKAFLENNRQYWDYVDSSLEESYKGVSRVKFYVEDNEDGARLLDAVKAD